MAGLAGNEDDTLVGSTDGEHTDQQQAEKLTEAFHCLCEGQWRSRLYQFLISNV
jgi:hypothetical protein